MPVSLPLEPWNIKNILVKVLLHNWCLCDCFHLSQIGGKSFLNAIGFITIMSLIEIKTVTKQKRKLCE